MNTKVEYRDVYLLVDLSASVEKKQVILKTNLQRMLWHMHSLYGRVKNGMGIRVTCVFFNHQYSIKILRLEPDKISSRQVENLLKEMICAGATNPVAPLAWAITDGLSRQAEMRARGITALPPAYFFLSDCYPDVGEVLSDGEYTFDLEAQQRLEKNFLALASDIRAYAKAGQICFFTYCVYTETTEKAKRDFSNELPGQTRNLLSELRTLFFNNGPSADSVSQMPYKDKNPAKGFVESLNEQNDASEAEPQESNNTSQQDKKTKAPKTKRHIFSKKERND